MNAKSDLYLSSSDQCLNCSPTDAGLRSLVDRRADFYFNPLGFSQLWFEPRSGHMWESQVLLKDGQVVFLRVLRFSPTFDE